MTDKPFSASALRGAVDLSALGNRGGAQRPAGGPGAPQRQQAPAAPSGTGPAAQAQPALAGAGVVSPAGGFVVDATDASLQEVVSASMRHLVLMVVWSTRVEQTHAFVEKLSRLAQASEGRFQLARVDVDSNPGILRALQVQTVPMTLALLQGQPVPLMEGIPEDEQLAQVIEQLLALAVQNGVTGRAQPVPGGAAPEPAEGDEDEQDELHPLIEQAYAAIEADDLDGAAAAYESFLAEHPGDEEARLGLAQVTLMKRTRGVDLQQARQAAADEPTNVQAQVVVADLDVLGGHVEDAFARLVDTVRATSGDDRDAARNHLLELFEVVGAQDPRVIAGRKALTSALF